MFTLGRGTRGVDLHTFHDALSSHVHYGTDATMSETFVPQVNVWQMGGIVSVGGSRRVSERYREIGKNIQSASDDSSALSNDVTLLVSNETGAQVEVGAIVVILIESEHRDEMDGRGRNKKCIIKSEATAGGVKENGPNTRSKDREIAKPTDRMGFNGVKIFKV